MLVLSVNFILGDRLWSRVLGLDFLALVAIAIDLLVAEVALEVQLRASTWCSLNDGLVVFAVVALRGLLASNIGHCLAEEALAITVSAIVWRPEFIVGIGRAWGIGAFALGFMELGKIDVGQKGAFASLAGFV